jgi:hypothetical protein
MVAKYRAELLEIHKGWPASAEDGKVLLQMFRGADAHEDRMFMWKTWQTLIHEYIHTLAHSKFSKYADNHPDKAKGHALREGMTDYLFKLVMSQTNLTDAALHKTVEGPYHDVGVVEKVTVRSGYAAAIEAEQLVGIVGANNAFAAFFLGRVELIGA